MKPVDTGLFWSKVKILGPEECWPWMAARVDGYGRYRHDGKIWRAHIIAFAINCGVFPTDSIIRHSCHNRACCNPKHLIDGTRADNNHDTVLAGHARGGNGGMPGSSNPATFLVEADVIRIRQLGLLMGPLDISKLPEYKGKISPGGILRILQHKSWKGV